MLITKEVRLEMARQIMQKLNLELSKPTTQGFQYPLDDVQVATPETLTPMLDPVTIRQRVSADDLFNRIGPLPPQTTFLGLCDDGLPLLFDMGDPTPGPILISGLHGTGKTRLLKTILLASSMLNTPDEFRFYVISPQPGKFRDLFYLDHCLDLVSSYDRAAIELVVNLAAITEQRRSGRFLGPITILAIDDLHELMKTEEFELNNHLKWLLEHGPRNGIWTIATLQPGHMKNLNQKIMSVFKTSLIASNGTYQLAQGRNMLTDGLINPFTSQIGKQHINFWIPEIY